jgi:hypothetical protein
MKDAARLELLRRNLDPTMSAEEARYWRQLRAKKTFGYKSSPVKESRCNLGGFEGKATLRGRVFPHALKYMS